MDVEAPSTSSVLILEPFYGGSHKQLVDTITSNLAVSTFELYTLPATKWHWRARTSALYFAQIVPMKHKFKVLFASSVLNLCELKSLRPDLSNLSTVVYFHENQLVYPVQEIKDRDFQYGYNQVLTCMVADHVVFNSHFNRSSFLDSIKGFFKLMPDYRPANLDCAIREKSSVLYFPVSFPPDRTAKPTSDVLHVVWPHRWEHDKDPETFFRSLFVLADEGARFRVSVVGEMYGEVPPVFREAKERLSDRIEQFGYAQSREEYYAILRRADVAVSTARHEFFGVAMMEATYCGCLPICPNRLVYPELYPKECLYNTEAQLVKMLRQFCKHPNLARHKRNSMHIDFSQYSWDTLQSRYMELLN